MFDKLKKQYQTNYLIRTAIDSYPDGICFAAQNGRPILASKTINKLAWEITGRTITNGEDMWKEISRRADSTKDNILLCKLPNGTIWQFQRKELSLKQGQFIQYEASDITELYHYRSRLVENNQDASLMHERQKELMKNIVQNNLDKELLHAKMHIHDAFGRVLIMTENELTHKSPESSEKELFAAWKAVISDMKNSAASGAENIQPENELVQVASLIGCHVEFEGRQPSARKPLLLLYAAIREALTNAVRHAGADKLTIHIEENDSAWNVRIESNGEKCEGPIHEGSGLTNLRRRLEQEGACLRYAYGQSLQLLLTIPKE